MNFQTRKIVKTAQFVYKNKNKKTSFVAGNNISLSDFIILLL